MRVWGSRGVSFPTEFERFYEMGERWVGADGADVGVVCGRGRFGRWDVNEKKRDRRSVRVQGGGL